LNIQAAITAINSKECGHPHYNRKHIVVHVHGPNRDFDELTPLLDVKLLQQQTARQQSAEPQMQDAPDTSARIASIDSIATAESCMKYIMNTVNWILKLLTSYLYFECQDVRQRNKNSSSQHSPIYTW
jgi:hypothetical protein